MSPSLEASQPPSTTSALSLERAGGILNGEEDAGHLSVGLKLELSSFID